VFTFTALANSPRNANRSRWRFTLTAWEADL
jgi:hypothetical protein